MHKIEIKKVANGVIITIGCQTFVEMDIDRAMKELGRYLKDPEGVEKEYAKKYGPFSLGTVGEVNFVSAATPTWTVTSG